MKNKTEAMQCPVVFYYPVNCAPGDEAFELAKQKDRETYFAEGNQREMYSASSYFVRDFNGVHVWRNVFTGRKEITSAIKKDMWGSWHPLPANYGDVYVSALGVGVYFKNRFIVENFVLCDDLTPEQKLAWDLYQLAFEASQKSKDKKPVQISLFVE